MEGKLGQINSFAYIFSDWKEISGSQVEELFIWCSLSFVCYFHMSELVYFQAV